MDGRGEETGCIKWCYVTAKDISDSTGLFTSCLSLMTLHYIVNLYFCASPLMYFNTKTTQYKSQMAIINWLARPIKRQNDIAEVLNVLYYDLLVIYIFNLNSCFFTLHNNQKNYYCCYYKIFNNYQHKYNTHFFKYKTCYEIKNCKDLAIRNGGIWWIPKSSWTVIRQILGRRLAHKVPIKAAFAI